MLDHVLYTLQTLREASRRSTLFSAVALATGVVMIPLSYRGGVAFWDRFALLAGAIVYVGLAAWRVSGGLRLERRLELEQRTVRDADRDGVDVNGKIGRTSTVVQAVLEAEKANPGDRLRVLRGTLRRTSRRLRVPRSAAAVPALLVLGGLWIRVALLHASQRNLPLFVVVILAMLILLLAEAWLLAVRRRVRRDVRDLVEQVVAWWEERRRDDDPTPFSHRVYYRDVADRLGLT